MAVAMVGAVMLVTDYVFSTGTMIACVAGTATALVVLWYLAPLRHLAGRS